MVTPTVVQQGRFIHWTKETTGKRANLVTRCKIRKSAKSCQHCPARKTLTGSSYSVSVYNYLHHMKYPEGASKQTKIHCTKSVQVYCTCGLPWDKAFMVTWLIVPIVVERFPEPDLHGHPWCSHYRTIRLMALYFMLLVYALQFAYPFLTFIGYMSNLPLILPLT